LNDSGNPYTEEQIKQLSLQNPDQIYESDDGKVAYMGVIYKNKKELEDTYRAVTSPVGRALFTFLFKLSSIFSFKKKSD
jgi:hypothetical protein